jgi:hypothetical protein
MDIQSSRAAVVPVAVTLRGCGVLLGKAKPEGKQDEKKQGKGYAGKPVPLFPGNDLQRGSLLFYLYLIKILHDFFFHADGVG